MSERRLDRMRGLLKENVADILLRKSKDQRLSAVNVTGVKLTPDLKKAIILYSIFGGDEVKASAKIALDKARGFVRSVLGETLGLKYTPAIQFEFDRNLEYAQHMSQLLHGLDPTDRDEARDCDSDHE